MKTVVSVCSARPNFVKLAAVHHALAARPQEFRHVIVHTGQHYDPLLSDVFFEQLHIPQPDFNLGVHGGTREEVIEHTQDAFAQILPQIDPDIVLVYGDVNGAVGAALATKEAGYMLGHVEAGLRSFDTAMPEEHNRVNVDGMADLLFCSEESGMEHLEAEGIEGEKFLVGNVMIDTLLRMLPAIEELPLPSAVEGAFAVATLHRPSNVDASEHLTHVIQFLGEVAEHIPVILPAHPRLKVFLEQSEVEVAENVFLIEPLGYMEFIRLMQDAAFILTDSGGIQEEAVILNKRCFTLRRNTERPSTIKSGSNVLVNPSLDGDRQQVLSFAQHRTSIKVTAPDVWDGKAGERIADILAEKL